MTALLRLSPVFLVKLVLNRLLVYLKFTVERAIPDTEKTALVED